MTGCGIRVLDPAGVAAATTAIVVPACNEVDRIGDCLRSLAAQEVPGGVAVVLCVNNTTDGSAEHALDIALAERTCLVLADVEILRGGVGQARRIGHALALRHGPSVRALLSTDADCVAHSGWARKMARALSRAPAALGRIDPTPFEGGDPPESYRACLRIEAEYTALSMAFENLVAAGPGRGIGINTAGGANLGIRADVYAAIGGYRPLPRGEDRDLMQRVLRAGHVPVRVPARVKASSRAEGRAPGGMATAIAERLRPGQVRLDTALVPFAAMLARHVGIGGPGPAMTSLEAERDLPALRACVARLRRIPSRTERLAYLDRLMREVGGPEASSQPRRMVPAQRLARVSPDSPAAHPGPSLVPARAQDGDASCAIAPAGGIDAASRTGQGSLPAAPAARIDPELRTRPGAIQDGYGRT